MRLDFGWCLKGFIRGVSCPKKSLNYSLIAALTINGFIGAKVIKGGLKGPDFIGFIHDLIVNQQNLFTNKKVVIILDNANIHHSKDYMQKFKEFYNIQYISPYTPQYNPIEYSFSKLKCLVKKSHPKTENDLIRGIYQSLKLIKPQDCAGYSLWQKKFLHKNIHN